jgi:FkbM family methyltransferase
MFIPVSKLIELFKINVRGIIHIGAHECEELKDYIKSGVPFENIYWIDALQSKVDLMKRRIPSIQIYQSVISDVDNEEVTFYITNNHQSSSIFEFGTHKTHHPWVVVTKTEKVKTTRMDTLMDRCGIDIDRVNFINLDIQGAELKALKGMESHLDKIDYIYTEINTEDVYKGCCKISELDEFLEKYGFKRVKTHMAENGKYGWGDAFYMRES